MSTPSGIQKKKFHPNTRKQVIAAADVSLRQVQVIDKTGRVRGIVVWQCGSDIFWANTMDALFDVSRRKTAPPWLIDQLKELPQDRRFHSDGTPHTAEVAATESGPSHVPSDADADLPSFAQA